MRSRGSTKSHVAATASRRCRRRLSPKRSPELPAGAPAVSSRNPCTVVSCRACLRVTSPASRLVSPVVLSLPKTVCRRGSRRSASIRTTVQADLGHGDGEVRRRRGAAFAPAGTGHQDRCRRREVRLQARTQIPERLGGRRLGTSQHDRQGAVAAPPALPRHGGQHRYAGDALEVVAPADPVAHPVADQRSADAEQQADGEADADIDPDRAFDRLARHDRIGDQRRVLGRRASGAPVACRSPPRPSCGKRRTPSRALRRGSGPSPGRRGCTRMSARSRPAPRSTTRPSRSSPEVISSASAAGSTTRPERASSFSVPMSGATGVVLARTRASTTTIAVRPVRRRRGHAHADRRRDHHRRHQDDPYPVHPQQPCRAPVRPRHPQILRSPLAHCRSDRCCCSPAGGERLDHRNVRDLLVIPGQGLFHCQPSGPAQPGAVGHYR